VNVVEDVTVSVRYYPNISLERLKKTTKASVRRAGIRVKIRTQGYGTRSKTANQLTAKFGVSIIGNKYVYEGVSKSFRTESNGINNTKGYGGKTH
jgi:hypothetical protein